jgi:hypothetical protein
VRIPGLFCMPCLSPMGRRAQALDSTPAFLMTILLRVSSTTTMLHRKIPSPRLVAVDNVSGPMPINCQIDQPVVPQAHLTMVRLLHNMQRPDSKPSRPSNYVSPFHRLKRSFKLKRCFVVGGKRDWMLLSRYQIRGTMRRNSRTVFGITE